MPSQANNFSMFLDFLSKEGENRKRRRITQVNDENFQIILPSFYVFLCAGLEINNKNVASPTDF